MGMGAGESSLFPNGDVGYSLFIKQDPSAEGFCLQAGAGDTPFGVSGPEPHRIAFDAYDDGLVGKAGSAAIKIYGVGATMIPLRLGGTVANGDYLKPDASGKGVATTTDHDKVGAVARAKGNAGDIIPVDVIRQELSR